METTSVTSQVTVLDILSGIPSAILTQEETNFRGRKRLFTQKVPVQDGNLFKQLCGQVRKGDKIEVTVVTEWHEDKSVIYLKAFVLLISPPLVEEKEVANLSSLSS
jgi:hypothetical protein